MNQDISCLQYNHPVYTDVCHANNCPAAAPPVETERVVYTDVNSKATDKTTGDSVCTKHTGEVSSNVKERVLFLFCVHVHPL